MVGCRLPSVLKYSAEAPKSSGLNAPWPWLSTSAWVCMSIATKDSTSMTRSLMSGPRPGRDGGRGRHGGYGRHRDAVALGLGTDSGGPGPGDGVRGPAAVGVVRGLLLWVRPQRELVATDADRLSSDVRRGVRGQEDDE